MNKQDLINAISDGGNISKTDADIAVNGVFTLIESALERGEDVRISGFGVFKRVATKARTCRNPHSGETIEVAAKFRAKFRPSSKLALEG